jgi:hypothetical protein
MIATCARSDENRRYTRTNALIRAAVADHAARGTRA